MATSSIPSVTQLQQLILLPGVVLVALGSIVGTLTTLLASSNHYTDMMMRPNPVPQDPPQVYDFVVGKILKFKTVNLRLHYSNS